MKTRFFAVLVVLAFIGGCKQDIDLTAKYQEVTIVYGLLSKGETTHYVRIQKGYLVDGNAYLAGGVADSIYYPDNLQVKLLPFYNGYQNGQAFNLTRVDGNTLNPPIPKEDGTFATTPNILYTFNGTLDPSRLYVLQITNPATGKVISASTKLVTDFTPIVPGLRGQHLNISFTSPTKIRWNDAPNATLYDVKVRFPYQEFDLATNTMLKDTFVDIFFAKSLASSDSLGTSFQVVDFDATTLLSALNNKIDIDDNGSHRAAHYHQFVITKGMAFYFSAGGTELSRYITSQNAQNSGLSTNEAIPPYTNITGGYGLFSSRLTVTMDSILFSNDALDTIACNSITSGLNFKTHTGGFCH